MKKAIYLNIFCAFFYGCNQPEIQTTNTLWYENPAKDWNEALPIGNGKLGGMVFGRVDYERIQLNEESVWTGSPGQVPDKPDAYKYLPEVRNLLFKGEYSKAQEITEKEIMAKEGWNMYQTLGDLFLGFRHKDTCSEYRRELSLDNAIAKVSYKSGKTEYKREYYSSVPDQVLIIELNASNSKALSFSMSMKREKDATISVDKNTITMSGQVTAGPADMKDLNPGVHYETQIMVVKEAGEIQISGDSLMIKDASKATIYLVAATNYWGDDPHLVCSERLEKVTNKDLKKIKQDHISEHQRLFNRVKLDLGTSENSNLPTDKRLEAFKNGSDDPSLLSLYFQYGRYMLISSSRPDDLAANLQGIWADGLIPPWSADYHININIQMNYWPAEVTNLSECHLPFIALVDSLRKNGRKTAKTMYNSRGFTAHFTTDAWYWTTSVGKAEWGMWPMGAAWCSQHLWEHYAFTQEIEYLEYAYPILKEASLFFFDYLTEDPKTGYLVTGPSSSPENKFKTPDGKISNITMGPAMDMEICYDLFSNTMEAAKILDIDQEFRDSLEILRSRLSPLKIGNDGRIMEWSKEFEEPEPGHRHISHLFALHPGKQITMHTPELMGAARKTIEYRLSHGGGHTGWSRAWIINFYARMLNGDKAYENLEALLQKSTLNNLFDVHPPFQIDGNFGGTAGIAEMLLQSHADEIHLLPALPKAWSSGSVCGLKARGNFEVDMEWEKGELKSAKIKSVKGGKCKIRLREKDIELDTESGKTYSFGPNLTEV
ncbi:MAG: glycoside hydrolase family 95 protein [Bacteroidales bacterium]|nr:glycoside hydrolase family 95 protein [Bacteroidales bacterium]MBN2820325.1 glycoside hydrolase family 95 protein [Bacteroidales bacterium]